MRVVFLTHNYPRFPGDVSGGFLHSLAVALQHRDVDVRIVAPSDKGNGGRSTLDGIPIHRVRYGSASAETLAYGGTIMSAMKSPYGWLGLASLLRNLRSAALAECDSKNKNLIHAHWWIPAGLAAPVQVPTVITCHGTDVRLIERNAIARRVALIPLHRAKVVTTVSNPLANALRQFANVTIRTDDVVPMPVAQIERPRTVGGGGIVVMGRLSEQKRVHLAIDAYAGLVRAGCSLPLTIAGDGAARVSLEAQAHALGLDNRITFLGEIPPTQVPALFATADLCLMPAINEGLGLAAAEALMQGVPIVVCNDGGGVLDIVPTSGGGRVVEPTSTAIASAALELLGDSSAQTAAILVGEEWRSRLNPDMVAERCLDWYQRALA